MLWTLTLLLYAIWLIAVMAHAAKIIHILLVVAVGLTIYQFVQGRRSE